MKITGRQWETTLANTLDCEYASTPFGGVDMPSRPLTWSITSRLTCYKCDKPLVTEED